MIALVVQDAWDRACMALVLTRLVAAAALVHALLAAAGEARADSFGALLVVRGRIELPT